MTGSWIFFVKKIVIFRSKEDLLSYAERQVKVIFGFEPLVQKENFLIRWSRKKKDVVGELIVQDSLEEEVEWTDFSTEENVIKNQISEQIFEEVS